MTEHKSIFEKRCDMPVVHVDDAGKPVFTIRKDIARYVNLTKKSWKKKPVFYRVHVYLYVRRLRDWKESFQEASAYIWSIITNRGKEISIPTCDVLLYYSSKKSNFKNRLDDLAIDLAKQGLRCGVLAVNQLFIYEPGHDGEVKCEQINGVADLLQNCLNRRKAIKNLFRSIWDTLILYVYLSKDRKILREYRNPIEVWNILQMYYHNFDSIDWLLSRLQPRMILTNHTLNTFAGAMMETKDAQKAIRIWYCNEHPGIYHLTDNTCDEIWCWNRLHIDTYKMLEQPDTHIQYRIIGHSETDAALSPRGKEISSLELSIEEKIRNKKVVLYLSNFIASSNGLNAKSEAVFLDLCEWFVTVSRQNPDWYFIYKPRPRRNDEMAPGLEKLVEIPNWLIIQSELSLDYLLRMEQIKIVAAESSLGLIAAAGAYKLPIQLISKFRKDYTFSNVEQVSFPVQTGIELGNMVKQYESIYPQYMDWMHEHEAEIFPYKRNVNRRMVELCLDLFSEPGYHINDAKNFN